VPGAGWWALDALVSDVYIVKPQKRETMEEVNWEIFRNAVDVTSRHLAPDHTMGRLAVTRYQKEIIKTYRMLQEAVAGIEQGMQGTETGHLGPLTEPPQ
jgi:hypothetical protein